MNDRVKKLVDALRSGEYEQAQSQLRRMYANHDAYCCLGVACDIFAKETGEGKWGDFGAHDEDGELFIAQKDSYPFTSESSMPEPVRKWFGFRTNSGGIDGYETFGQTLINLNDGGKSFAEIADFIEENYDGLVGELKE